MIFHYHTPHFFFITSLSLLNLLTSGIQQGLSPRPALFVGGTNSIAIRVTHCKKKFSSMTKTFILSVLVEELPWVIGQINEVLEIAVTESRSFGIHVNSVKTKVVTFDLKVTLRKIDSSNLLPVLVNRLDTPISSKSKNLGLILTSNLFWDKQVLIVTC